MRRDRDIFCVGSIESVTGWSGAHSDDPPSAVQATTPGAKHIAGSPARCFSVSEGEPVFYKSASKVIFVKSPDLEIKSEASGRIVGYGSVFGNVDSHREIVAAGAFTKSIQQHQSQKSMPLMLWMHKTDRPIGRWTSMAQDNHGLLVEGQLNLKTEAGKEAFEHLSGGDLDGLSIGFRVPDGGSHYAGDGVTLLKELELVEVSIVSLPSNAASRVTSIKSLSSKTELVDLLREAGLAKLAAQKVASGGWPALSGADHQKAIDFAAQIEAATAKLRSL